MWKIVINGIMMLLPEKTVQVTMTHAKVVIASAETPNVVTLFLGPQDSVTVCNPAGEEVPPSEGR